MSFMLSSPRSFFRNDYSFPLCCVLWIICCASCQNFAAVVDSQYAHGINQYACEHAFAFYFSVEMMKNRVFSSVSLPPRIYTQQKNIDHHTNLSNNLHNNAPSNDISPCKILTTSASTSSCAAANQCERKSTESAQNETTISSNIRNFAAATVAITTTTAPSTNSHPSDLPASTIASTTPTHIVSTARKKASSFLHRDYRRKKVLARSQVSFVEFRRDEASGGFYLTQGLDLV